MSIGQRSLLLLFRQLVNGVLGIGIEGAGGDKQTAGVSVVANAGGERGIACQQLLLCA